MSRDTNATKPSIHDRIESQISAARTRLDALKTKARSATAQAELKLIDELQASQKALEAKLNQMKKSNEAADAQAKTDIESRIADLEKKVHAVEVRFKTA
jgi:phage shock protein A